jgi:acetyl-CoA acetyltransferase
VTNASHHAIVGVGLTPQGKVYGRTYLGFAIDAVNLALTDSGIARKDVDGLLVNTGLSWTNPALAATTLQHALGLGDLGISLGMSCGGATAAAMVQYACSAIDAGLASVVACVFSDAPLKPPAADRTKGSGRAAAYAQAREIDATYGYFGVNARYAMIARRHMHVYGTTQDDLGSVAVAQRRWALGNDRAEMNKTPLSLADYHASRWIVEPFHLLDCCLVSNGGACIIVTSGERARDLAATPVPVLGFGQGHPGGDPLESLITGAVHSGKRALGMAGLTLADIDVAELYDCYTFTVLISLEDYGFCAKGEAGALVASGATSPGGTLPVNTGGGQLSSYYMWGMTPLVEAVTQLRGEGGARQVEGARTALVSGNGGILSTHATLILGRS